MKDVFLLTRYTNPVMQKHKVYQIKLLFEQFLKCFISFSFLSKKIKGEWIKIMFNLFSKHSLVSEK